MRGAFLDNGVGSEIDEPSIEDIRGALLAFSRNQVESGEILLMVRGDTISWLADGTIQLAAPTEIVRELPAVDLERASELFSLFLASDWVALEAFSWQPKAEVESPEQRHAHEQRYFARLVDRAEREMLEALGPERPDVPCRREGCDRGAVQHSVLCRTHHVEQLRAT